MKKILVAPALFAVVLLAGPASAQTVSTTTKTTTYSGVVSDINPSASTIILKSEGSNMPVTYSYTKETSFIDANGNVVSYESIKNSPVRVEYMTNGAGQTVVTRVVQTGPAVVVPAPAVPVMPAPAVPQPPAVMHREKTTTHTETRD